jgi:hypothetical protein
MLLITGNDQIRKAEGIRPQIGATGLIEGADQHHRHRKKTGSLIKIIYNTYIFKFFGHPFLHSLGITIFLLHSPQRGEEKFCITGVYPDLTVT